MGRIGFIFSGQGDQYPGMGKALAGKEPAAAAVFELCDRLRPGTMRQCFEGTAEELKETANTQPCLFAVELAAARVLLERGIRPEAAAGFSLGEMTAATVSGLMEDEAGFRLVCRRGRLMQEAAKKHETSMAAVVRLTREQVEELCGRYEGIYPVNYNCPGQITVSGLASVMPDFLARVKEAGGRGIPLQVGGAFHSPFMKEAAEAFGEELSRTVFGSPSVRLYSSMTALPYTEDVPGLLSRQICSPVQWESTARRMIQDGIDTFLEIGPGRTLTNMVKKIDTGVRAISLKEWDEQLC